TVLAEPHEQRQTERPGSGRADQMHAVIERLCCGSDECSKEQGCCSDLQPDGDTQRQRLLTANAHLPASEGTDQERNGSRERIAVEPDEHILQLLTLREGRFSEQRVDDVTTEAEHSHAHYTIHDDENDECESDDSRADW
ncbi:hypothetical protein PMAYCL1PPCAC_23037, partial [Pristionchus mayeri]